MKKLTLAEAKSRYTRNGFCDHEYCKYIKPYGCTCKINTCLVCAKTFDKIYA